MLQWYPAVLNDLCTDEHEVDGRTFGAVSSAVLPPPRPYVFYGRKPAPLIDCLRQLHADLGSDPNVFVAARKLKALRLVGQFVSSQSRLEDANTLASDETGRCCWCEHSGVRTLDTTHMIRGLVAKLPECVGLRIPGHACSALFDRFPNRWALWRSHPSLVRRRNGSVRLSTNCYLV